MNDFESPRQQMARGRVEAEWEWWLKKLGERESQNRPAAIYTVAAILAAASLKERDDG